MRAVKANPPSSRRRKSLAKPVAQSSPRRKRTTATTSHGCRDTCAHDDTAEPPLPGIRLFDLDGRTALVTGGSKGLGYAMAAGLASAGANVMLVSRHLEEAGKPPPAIARDFGRKAFAHAADVTVPGKVEAMIAAAERELGKVDILINSAGINIRGPICELTLEQFAQVMTTNVTGTWLCCRAVLPGMRARKWGRIINVSQRARARRSRRTHALRGEQGRRRAIDAHARARNRRRWHHRECHLPRPVPHRR